MLRGSEGKDAAGVARRCRGELQSTGARLVVPQAWPPPTAAPRSLIQAALQLPKLRAPCAQSAARCSSASAATGACPESQRHLGALQAKQRGAAGGVSGGRARGSCRGRGAQAKQGMNAWM